MVTARESAGLTQTQLGEKLGLSQCAIAHWERGTTALRPDQLETLAKVIKVSVDELVSGKDSRPAESGPKGKARRVFESVSRFPHRQQQKIVEVVEALVAQHAHTA